MPSFWYVVSTVASEVLEKLPKSYHFRDWSVKALSEGLRKRDLNSSEG
jgi:hypothetical protein